MNLDDFITQDTQLHLFFNSRLTSPKTSNSFEIGELINVPYLNRCKTQYMHEQCGNIIRRSEYALSLARKAKRLLSIPPCLSQNPTGFKFLTRLWRMEADTLERLRLLPERNI